MRLRLAAVLGLAAAVLAGPLAAAPAHAATPRAGDVVAPDLIGYDVSFPQCAKLGDAWTAQLAGALPVQPAFGIVGLNEGLGNTDNPCFAAQLQWALTATAVTSQPRVGLYVNTQNPGPLEASWWPDGATTQRGTVVQNPFGTCTHTASAACAYVYGYSMAEADVDRAVRNQAVPAAYTWWLDVEQSNDWSADRTANRAVLEGMTTAFSAAGAGVGLYSTHQQWDAIVGRVPAGSPLTTAPSWLAGAVTQRGAAENCTHAPLTAGRVTLAQYTDGVLDYDIACGRFPATRSPTVSGAARVGARLTAHRGSWAPGGIRFSYTWLRDGQAIHGATGLHYVLRAADAGKRISVRVTGTKLAFATVTRTSGTVHVQARPAAKHRAAPHAAATRTARAKAPAAKPAPIPSAAAAAPQVTSAAPTVVPTPPAAAVVQPSGRSALLPALVGAGTGAADGQATIPLRGGAS